MFRDQQSPVSKPYLWIPQFGGTITVGSATCFYATRWGFPHTEIGRSFPQAEKKGFGGTITIGSATGFYVRQGWCCLHAERKKERKKEFGGIITISRDPTMFSDEKSPVFEQKSHVSGKATIWRDYHNLAGSQDAQLEQS